MKLLNKKNLLILLFSSIIVFTIMFVNNSKTIFSKVVLDDTANNSPSSASYEYFTDYASANKKIDLAFTGEITKVYPIEKLTIGESKDPSTGKIVDTLTDNYIVSDIKVDKTIKGNCKSGDIIKVKQIKELETSSSSNFFKVGEKYIFFLQSYDNSKFNVPCSPINPLQGSIPIVNGKIKKSNNAQFIKSGLSEDSVVTELKEKVLKLKQGI